MKNSSETEQKKHWIHYEFNKRQRRTLLVLALFVVMGFFSTYMYIRSDGEYGETSQQLLENILDIEAEQL